MAEACECKDAKIALALVLTMVHIRGTEANNPERTMYQVTAIYDDAEVGYGESDIYEDAVREAAESVPSIYPEESVVMVCANGALEVRTPLDVWRMFA